jgi:hypothetical protein|tara:strand:- start:296 stop:949 length:654 start_codon:yes stop_codon:yes gene_type:complete
MISYYDFNNIVTVIDATLFKYNYIDNKILTLVKNQLDYRVVNDGSLLISSEQLSVFLKENFQSDINRINATGFEQFHKEATTIYFLHKMVSDFTNLEYIKLTINTNKSYSRLSDIDGVKTLRFNFKVLAGTFKLYDIFQNEKDLQEINSTLISLGLMKKNVPYARHNASHIFNALDSFVRSREGSDEKQFDTALDLMDCIEAKIQDDNPKIMLITDY